MNQNVGNVAWRVFQLYLAPLSLYIAGRYPRFSAMDTSRAVAYDWYSSIDRFVDIPFFVTRVFRVIFFIPGIMASQLPTGFNFTGEFLSFFTEKSFILLGAYILCLKTRAPNLSRFGVHIDRGAGIPFILTVVLLTGVTMFGQGVAKDNLEWYQSEYDGQMIEGGQAADGVSIKVKILKSHTPAVGYGMSVDIEGGSGGDESAKKTLKSKTNQYSTLRCYFHDNDGFKQVNVGIDRKESYIKYKMHTSIHDDPGCKEIQVAFLDFDNAVLKTASGLVVKMKRVRHLDGDLVGHQIFEYKKALNNFTTNRIYL